MVELIDTHGSGSGDGSGYGDGSGDGSGYGDGYGDGSGDGSGDGYGYGYGDGYGDGYGSGDGYGDGSGDGYGDGYGYGDGSGDERAVEAYYAALVDTAPTAARARSDGAVLALWRSNCEGRPANGGRGKPVAVGTIDETAGPLNLCAAGTLHATWRPDKWQGERLWIVALYGPVAIGDNKLGALKRQILAEVIQP